MGRGARELETDRPMADGRSGSSWSARSAAVSLAGLLVGGLLLTGCTSSDTPAPTSTATSGSPPPVTATPVSTPVQAPTPGSTEASVPSQKITKRKAVTLDGRGTAADDVTVTLTKVAAITAKAVGPGEVSGPGLAVTVAVKNGTSQPVDLGSAVVNATASDDTPAAAMTGKPARSLKGSVEPGATASGVYVFTLAKGRRDPVTVEVTVTSAGPVVVFRGRAAS